MRRLDPRQQQELTEFVNDVARRAGYTSNTSWEAESGYARESLSKLRNGRGGVDGYNLLRLIRSAADRMDVSPEDVALVLRTPSRTAEAEALHRRLDEVHDVLVELGERIGALVELQQQVLAHLPRPTPQQRHGTGQPDRGDA